MKDPELGGWVGLLRANKKKLQERGLAWEPEDEDESDAKMEPEEPNVKVEGVEAASSSNKASDKEKKKNTFLTKDRVMRLNSISFPWSVLPTRATFDERLEELRRFKELNGRWPTNREGSIGNWLKIHRKLYTKNDADFMANKLWKVSFPHLYTSIISVESC